MWFDPPNLDTTRHIRHQVEIVDGVFFHTRCCSSFEFFGEATTLPHYLFLLLQLLTMMTMMVMLTLLPYAYYYYPFLVADIES